MLDIIGTLLDVGLKVFGLRSDLSRARQERKVQVADFLCAIAANLKDVSGSLKAGVYPHGSCQKLLTHSQELKAAIGDLIGDLKADELANSLREVWQIEQLFNELTSTSPADRDRRLHVLDQAAGLLEATADVVRVSK